MTRRASIKALSAGALAFPFVTRGEQARARRLRFGIVGYGSIGEVITDQLLMLIKTGEQVAVSAICDIWEYRQKKGALHVKHMSGHEPRLYTDCSEMLRKEKGKLDAVIVASPDSFHEKHVLACLEAGVHVFCESPLADSVAAAQRIVSAVKQSGLVFHYSTLVERTPWAQYCKDHFIGKDKLLGDVVVADSEMWVFPKRRRESAATSKPEDAILSRYGYDSVEEFLNWRYSGKFGVSHDLFWFIQQADYFNELLPRRPAFLIASRSDIDGVQLAKAINATVEYVHASGKTLCTSRFLPLARGHNFHTFKLTGQHGIVLHNMSAERYVQQTNAIPGTGSGDFHDNSKMRWKDAYENGVLGRGYEQAKEMDGYVPSPFQRGHNGKFHFPDHAKFGDQSCGVRNFIHSICGASQVSGFVQNGLASMILAEAVLESASTGKKVRLT